MKSLLRLSENRAVLLRAGALVLSGYLAVWAFVAVQFGAGERATTSAAHGAQGWGEALEPIKEKKGVPLIIPENLEETKESLKEIDQLQRLLLGPQPQSQAQPIIVAIPADRSGGSPVTSGVGQTTTAQKQGADNGPAPPSARITRVTPDDPRVGRTTRVEF
jgi:hypothetical protein